MISRIHISSFIALTIIVWLFALWIQGQPVLSMNFLKPFSLVVGVISFIVWIFNKYGWAWKIFQNWYVKRPDLRGTWLTELKSDWINPETNERVSTIICYMVVRQTLTSLSMRLITAESRSNLIAHSIFIENDGIYRVACVYRNEPKLELQGDRSEIHHGSFLFEVYGSPPTSLEGNYWTDRKTRGTLTLSNRKKELFENFETARAAFQP
jgi:hypothetical protein